MGNYNRLLRGDVLLPERFPLMDADEWAVLEADIREERDDIEAQGMQGSQIGTLDY